SGTTAAPRTASSARPSRPRTRATGKRAPSAGHNRRYSLRNGAEAAENAPTANRRRKKLGILKATENGSARAPKYCATTTSRITPSTRLSKVIRLTMDDERSKPGFLLAGGTGG